MKWLRTLIGVLFLFGSGLPSLVQLAIEKRQDSRPQQRQVVALQNTSTPTGAAYLETSTNPESPTPARKTSPAVLSESVRKSGVKRPQRGTVDTSV